LAFLRKIRQATQSEEIKMKIDQFFKSEAASTTNHLTHLIGLELARALIDAGNYSAAMTKLRSLDENVSFPHLSDRTIRLLARIPLEYSRDMLEAFVHHPKVSNWMSEYALRVIAQLEQSRAEVRLAPTGPSTPPSFEQSVQRAKVRQQSFVYPPLADRAQLVEAARVKVAPRAEVRKNNNYNKNFLIGVGDRTPDWWIMRVIGATLLERKRKYPNPVKFEEILKPVQERLKGHNFRTRISEEHIRSVLDRLMKEYGVVKKVADGYEINEDYRVFAVQMSDVSYIEKELVNALANLKASSEAASELELLINDYSVASERFHLAPIESRWPILKAISRLKKDDLKLLINFLSERHAMRQKHPLVDHILHIWVEEPSKLWLRRFVPHLVGSTIYYISAETWLAAGGLGRVGQYHTLAAKELIGNDANLVTIEPFYPFKVVEDEQGSRLERTVDYSQLPIPIEGLGEDPKNPTPFFEFKMRIRRGGPNDRKEVTVQVFKGKNKFGIDTYLFRDKPEENGEEYYTKLLYRYGEHGAASLEEFTEFASKASLKIVKKLRMLDQQNQNPSAIWVNDGQLGVLPYFKRVSDRLEEMTEAQREQVRTDPKDVYHELRDLLQDVDEASLLESDVLFTSHTYRNTVYGDWRFVHGMRIPEEDRHYFESKEYPGVYDATKAGATTADAVNGVSATQAGEVSERNQAQFIGITNGDNWKATREVLIQIFNDSDFQKLFPSANSEYPTEEELVEAKIRGKVLLSQNEVLNRLNPLFAKLDPNKMIMSNTGRSVEEKVDELQAFDPDNIRAIVKTKNAQIIIAANIQGNPESRALYKRLKALEQELIDSEGRPGLIVVSGWGIPEQKYILAATDIAILVSKRDNLPDRKGKKRTRGTEAAGLTEADFPALGALVYTSPYREAIFTEHGEIINWNERGYGNTIIPEDESPAAHRAALLEAVKQYQTDRLKFASYQVTSIRLSRILSARPTAAEYLRYLDKTHARKNDPVGVLKRHLAGEAEGEFFRSEWLRQKLILALKKGEAEAVELGSDNEHVKSFAVNLGDYPRVVIIEEGLRRGNNGIATISTREILKTRMNFNDDDWVRVSNALTGQDYGSYQVSTLIERGLYVDVPEDINLQVLNIEPTTKAVYVEPQDVTRAALFHSLSIGSPKVQEAILGLIPQRLFDEIERNHGLKKENLVWYTPEDDFTPAEKRPRTWEEPGFYLVVNKGDGRINITLTPTLKGIFDQDRRREMTFKGEAFAHIGVAAAGDTLWIEYGHINMEVEERHAAFKEWFKDNLMPWAKKFGFSNIKLEQRSLDNEDLRGLNFIRDRITDETKQPIWTYTLYPAVHQHESLILAVNVADLAVDLRVKPGSISSVDGIKNVIEILPFLASKGFGKLYLTGGVFHMGDISKVLHAVSHRDHQAIEGREGKVRVWTRDYETKRQEVTLENGQTVIIEDNGGNTFSIVLDEHSRPDFNPELSNHRTDDGLVEGTSEETRKDLEKLIQQAHALGMEVILDFIPWLAPEAINERNYHWTFHKKLPEEDLVRFRALPTEEEKKKFLDEYNNRDGSFFALRIGEGENEEVVLIKHVQGAPNIDQAMLNPFVPEVREYYLNYLKYLIDLGVDGVRADLAGKLLNSNLEWLFHQGLETGVGFDAANEVWPVLIQEAKKYAEAKGRKFTFLMEVYDEGEVKKLHEFGADSLYYKNVFADYLAIAKQWGPKKAGDLQKSFAHAFRSAQGLAGDTVPLTIFPSNDDQLALRDIGGAKDAVLMQSFAMANAGVSTMVTLRDLMAVGLIRPHPGGSIRDRAPRTDDESGHSWATPQEIPRRTFWDELKQEILDAPGLTLLTEFNNAIKVKGQDYVEFNLDTSNTDRVRAIAWKEPQTGDWLIIVADHHFWEGATHWIDLPKRIDDSPASNLVAYDLTKSGAKFEIDVEGKKIVNLKFGPDEQYKFIRITNEVRAEVRSIAPEVQKAIDESEVLSRYHIDLKIAARAKRDPLQVLTKDEFQKLSTLSYLADQDRSYMYQDINNMIWDQAIAKARQLQKHDEVRILETWRGATILEGWGNTIWDPKTDQVGFIFGVSETGKSRLSKQLQDQGMKVLSEDISFLYLVGDRLLVANDFVTSGPVESMGRSVTVNVEAMQRFRTLDFIVAMNDKAKGFHIRKSVRMPQTAQKLMRHLNVISTDENGLYTDPNLVADYEKAFAVLPTITLGRTYDARSHSRISDDQIKKEAKEVIRWLNGLANRRAEVRVNVGDAQVWLVVGIGSGIAVGALALRVYKNWRQKNRIVRKNVESIFSSEFQHVWGSESIGGNAGVGHSAVNGVMAADGEIVEFGNRQELSPRNQERVYSRESDRTYEFTIRVKVFGNSEGPIYEGFMRGAVPKKASSVFIRSVKKADRIARKRESAFPRAEAREGTNTTIQKVLDLVEGVNRLLSPYRKEHLSLGRPISPSEIKRILELLVLHLKNHLEGYMELGLIELGDIQDPELLSFIQHLQAIHLYQFQKVFVVDVATSIALTGLFNMDLEAILERYGQRVIVHSHSGGYDASQLSLKAVNTYTAHLTAYHDALERLEDALKHIREAGGDEDSESLAHADTVNISLQTLSRYRSQLIDEAIRIGVSTENGIVEIFTQVMQQQMRKVDRDELDRVKDVFKIQISRAEVRTSRSLRLRVLQSRLINLKKLLAKTPEVSNTVRESAVRQLDEVIQKFNSRQFFEAAQSLREFRIWFTNQPRPRLRSRYKYHSLLGATSTLANSLERISIPEKLLAWVKQRNIQRERYTQERRDDFEALLNRYYGITMLELADTIRLNRSAEWIKEIFGTYKTNTLFKRGAAQENFLVSMLFQVLGVEVSADLIDEAKMGDITWAGILHHFAMLTKQQKLIEFNRAEMRKSEVPAKLQELRLAGGLEELISILVRDWDKIKASGLFVFDMQKTLTARKTVATDQMVELLAWLLSEGIRIEIDSGNTDQEVLDQVITPLQNFLSSSDKLVLIQDVMVVANSGTLMMGFDFEGKPIYFPDYQRDLAIPNEVTKTSRAILRDLAQEEFLIQEYLEKVVKPLAESQGLNVQEEMNKAKDAVLKEWEDMYKKEEAKEKDATDVTFDLSALHGSNNFEPAVVHYPYLSKGLQLSAPHIQVRGLVTISDKGELPTKIGITKFHPKLRGIVIARIEQELQQRLPPQTYEDLNITIGGESTIDITSKHANKALGIVAVVKRSSTLVLRQMWRAVIKGRWDVLWERFTRFLKGSIHPAFIYVHGDELTGAVEGEITPTSHEGNDRTMMVYDYPDPAFKQMKGVAVTPKPPVDLNDAALRTYYVAGEQPGRTEKLVEQNATEFYLGRLRQAIQASRSRAEVRQGSDVEDFDGKIKFHFDESGLLEYIDIFHDSETVAAMQEGGNNERYSYYSLVSDSIVPGIRQWFKQIRMRKISDEEFDGIDVQLFELLINAFHAVEQAGKGRIRIRLQRGNEGEAVFVVLNDGPGIPMEILDQLVLKQMSTKKDSIAEGLGLGLFGAKRLSGYGNVHLEILTRHQGQIGGFIYALQSSKKWGRERFPDERLGELEEGFNTRVAFTLPFKESSQTSVRRAEVRSNFLYESPHKLFVVAGEPQADAAGIYTHLTIRILHEIDVKELFEEIHQIRGSVRALNIFNYTIRQIYRPSTGYNVHRIKRPNKNGRYFDPRVRFQDNETIILILEGIDASFPAVPHAEVRTFFPGMDFLPSGTPNQIRLLYHDPALMTSIPDYVVLLTLNNPNGSNLFPDYTVSHQKGVVYDVRVRSLAGMKTLDDIERLQPQAFITLNFDDDGKLSWWEPIYVEPTHAQNLPWLRKFLDDELKARTEEPFLRTSSTRRAEVRDGSAVSRELTHEDLEVYFIAEAKSMLSPSVELLRAPNNDSLQGAFELPVLTTKQAQADSAKEMVDRAIQYIENRISEAGEQKASKVSQRLAHFKNATNVYGVSMPTLFFVSNSQTDFVKTIRISFRRKRVYIPLLFMNHYLHSDNPMDVAILAHNLDLAQLLIDSFDELRAQGKSDEEIRIKITELEKETSIERDNFMFDGGEKRELKKRMSGLIKEDKKLSESENWEVVRKELDWLTGIYRQYQRLALHYQTLNDMETARDYYLRALDVAHKIQKVDSGGIQPFTTQYDIVLTLLRALPAGLIEEFTREFKVLLNEGFPQSDLAYDRKGDPQIEIDRQRQIKDFRRGTLPYWLAKGVPDALYKLEVYAAMVGNDPAKHQRAFQVHDEVKQEYEKFKIDIQHRAEVRRQIGGDSLWIRKLRGKGFVSAGVVSATNQWQGELKSQGETTLPARILPKPSLDQASLISPIPSRFQPQNNTNHSSGQGSTDNQSRSIKPQGTERADNRSRKQNAGETIQKFNQIAALPIREDHKGGNISLIYGKVNEKLHINQQIQTPGRAEVRNQYPEVIQHRSNSRAQILKAIESRADGIEMDLQMTRDGYIVLQHDTIEADGREYFAVELTLNEIKRFNPKLLTLEEALSIEGIKNKLLELEIKNLDIFPPHAELIEKRGNQELLSDYGLKITRKIVEILKNTIGFKNVTFASFDIEKLKLLKNLAPGARTAYTVDIKPGDSDRLNQAINNAKLANIDVLGMMGETLTPQYIQMIKLSGIALSFGGAPDIIEQLAPVGGASFVVDDVEATFEVLERLGIRSRAEVRHLKWSDFGIENDKLTSILGPIIDRYAADPTIIEFYEPEDMTIEDYAQTIHQQLLEHGVTEADIDAMIEQIFRVIGDSENFLTNETAFFLGALAYADSTRRGRLLEKGIDIFNIQFLGDTEALLAGRFSGPYAETLASLSANSRTLEVVGDLHVLYIHLADKHPNGIEMTLDQMWDAVPHKGYDKIRFINALTGRLANGEDPQGRYKVKSLGHNRYHISKPRAEVREQNIRLDLTFEGKKKAVNEYAFSDGRSNKEYPIPLEDLLQTESQTQSLLFAPPTGFLGGQKIIASPNNSMTAPSNTSLIASGAAEESQTYMKEPAKRSSEKRNNEAEMTLRRAVSNMEDKLHQQRGAVKNINHNIYDEKLNPIRRAEVREFTPKQRAALSTIVFMLNKNFPGYTVGHIFADLVTQGEIIDENLDGPLIELVTSLQEVGKKGFENIAKERFYKSLGGINQILNPYKYQIIFDKLLPGNPFRLKNVRSEVREIEPKIESVEMVPSNVDILVARMIHGSLTEQNIREIAAINSEEARAELLKKLEDEVFAQLKKIREEITERVSQQIVSQLIATGKSVDAEEVRAVIQRELNKPEPIANILPFVQFEPVFETIAGLVNDYAKANPSELTDQQVIRATDSLNHLSRSETRRMIQVEISDAQQSSSIQGAADVIAVAPSLEYEFVFPTARMLAKARAELRLTKESSIEVISFGNKLRLRHRSSGAWDLDQKPDVEVTTTPLRRQEALVVAADYFNDAAKSKVSLEDFGRVVTAAPLLLLQTGVQQKGTIYRFPNRSELSAFMHVLANKAREVKLQAIAA